MGIAVCDCRDNKFSVRDACRRSTLWPRECAKSGLTRDLLSKSRGTYSCDSHQLEPSRDQMESSRGQRESDRNQIESNRNQLESHGNQIESNRNQIGQNRTQIESTRIQQKSNRIK